MTLEDRKESECDFHPEHTMIGIRKSNKYKGGVKVGVECACIIALQIAPEGDPLVLAV